MKIILMLCAISLFGCKAIAAAEAAEVNKDDTVNKLLISSEMHYYKDPRTDLCFAAYHNIWAGQSTQVLTNVPCTEKVEKLLK